MRFLCGRRQRCNCLGSCRACEKPGMDSWMHPYIGTMHYTMGCYLWGRGLSHLTLRYTSSLMAMFFVVGFVVWQMRLSLYCWSVLSLLSHTPLLWN